MSKAITNHSITIDAARQLLSLTAKEPSEQLLTIVELADEIAEWEKALTEVRHCLIEHVELVTAANKELARMLGENRALEEKLAAQEADAALGRSVRAMRVYDGLTRNEDDWVAFGSVFGDRSHGDTPEAALAALREEVK